MTTTTPIHLSQLVTDQWLNSTDHQAGPELQGRPVFIHTFQMLCPGCILHSLPLVKEVRMAFPKSELHVIGLHTVFEHHEAMGITSLQAFLHEFQLTHPIAIDSPSTDDHRPQTMRRWNLRGTPSYLLFDSAGELALHQFGSISSVELGAAIARLIGQPAQSNDSPQNQERGQKTNAGCDGDACRI